MLVGFKWFVVVVDTFLKQLDITNPVLKRKYQLKCSNSLKILADNQDFIVYFKGFIAVSLLSLISPCFSCLLS